MFLLETPRMIIRNFVPEDCQDLFEIFGDQETMKNCEPAYDFAKTEDFLKSFCIERHSALAAVEKQSRKMIGYLLFNEFDPGVYEIGWIFNRQIWHQGYAFEACKAIRDYAFREMDAHKLFAEAIDSVKSVGLMRKLGMKEEGIQRRQTLDLEGNWVDLYFYGLLKEDCM